MSRSRTASAEVLLAGFAGYLREQRGVSALTVDAYVADVRRFVACRGDASSLHELSAAEVSKAVLHEVAGRSPATVRRYGCALRAFLRYCRLAGLIETDLPAAVLPVAGRRRSLLPQGLTEAQALALLRVCDRRRAVGRRDYTVIVLMLRLGLRWGGRGAAAGGHRLARRAGHRAWQARTGGPVAAASRCREGDRRIPAARQAAHRGAAGVRANGPAAGGAEPQRRVDDRPARVRAGRAGAVRSPPAAAHHSLQHAARRWVAGRDRSGSSA